MSTDQLLDQAIAEALRDQPDEDLAALHADETLFLRAIENEQARRKLFHAHEREDQS